MVKGDYTVYLTVIDSHVYNFDQNVVDIIYGLQNYERVILDVIEESPDFTNLGIGETLRKIIDTYNVPYGKLILRTGNLAEQSNILPIEIHDRLDPKLQYLAHNDIAGIKMSPIKKDISKHFGIYIGRSNYTRLALASYLDMYYSDLTDITFHCDPCDDFHKSHIGLDKLLHYFGVRHPVSRAATQFIQKIPITKDLVVEYPITTDKPIVGLSNSYSNIFMDVVCETMFTGDVFSGWTEKTRRTMLFETPFLLFGPRNFLAHLKKLGYKTFSNWWNESYDYSEGVQRINEMTRIIDDLAKKPLTEIRAMHNDMTDTLKYNRNLLLERATNVDARIAVYDEFKKQFSISR